MSDSLVPYLPTIQPEAVSRALLAGDLSKLTPEDRIQYYLALCHSSGLNPLTRPFIVLRAESGEMVWYATRECAEQLRKLHRVSMRVLSRERTDDGLYIVTVEASTPEGRVEQAQGIVPLAKAKGSWKTTQQGKRYFEEAKTPDGEILLQPLHGAELANALHKAECVPLDSEILTREGWKTYDVVCEGEEVLAYDCSSDTCCWTPLQAITVYDRAPLVELCTANHFFSVVCTPDHTWAIRMPAYKPDRRGGGSRGPRGPYRTRGALHRLITTTALKSNHRLVLAAPTPTPEESLLSPVEAAVLGWAVTDGTIQRRGAFVRVGICQSKEQHMPIIRETMAMAAGSDVREIVTPGGFRTFAHTGRTSPTKPQSWWYLPSAVGRALLAKAGYHDRYDLPRIVTRLSSSARQAMLQAMMLAEGDRRNVFANKDRHILDALEILCALEGHATSLLRPKDPIFTKRVKLVRHFAQKVLQVIPAGEGPVWCPTTAYGTWVMRQRGRVLITGNSKAKRRATLALCGLGLPDAEPDAGPAVRFDPQTGVLQELSTPEDGEPLGAPVVSATQAAQNVGELFDRSEGKPEEGPNERA